MPGKKCAVTFLIFFSVLLSCKNNDNKIRLGILPVIDTLPLIAADAEGLFKKEGADVELVFFNSALEKEAALTAGNIDGSFGDLITSLLMVKNGIPVVYVCESSRTGPSKRIFGLLAAPGSKIKSLNEIGSERVAISKGSIIEYFLDRIAESKGLKKEKIQKLEIKGIPVRYQMLMSGSIKLALLPEPLVTKAENDGAKLLADDSKLNTTATVVLFRKDFAGKRPEAVKGFVRAYNEIAEKINSSPDSYRKLMVTKIRFPEELKDSYPVPKYNKAASPAEKDVMMVHRWMKEKKLIDQNIDYSSMVWRQAD